MHQADVSVGEALRLVRTAGFNHLTVGDDGDVTLEQVEIPVRELARKTGVSHTQISRIESGSVASPSVDVLIDLAKGLSCRPAPLLIVAGHITGEDARAELVWMFRPGAELADVWGDWAHLGWEQACALVRDPNASDVDLKTLAFDVFVAGETNETLWEGEPLVVPIGPGQAPLRMLLNSFEFVDERRRASLVEYASALRRLQELEELADAETWHHDVPQDAADVDDRTPFSDGALRDRGFEGFGRLLGLGEGGTQLPQAPGVYVVLRRSLDAPTFLDRSVGGHFKGEDPTVDTARLSEEWVDGASVLYVGRAANLRQRISLLARYGHGLPVAHRGGRLLWQLADHGDLLIAWLETTDQVRREAELVAEFEEVFGALPFANLNRPSGGA